MSNLLQRHVVPCPYGRGRAYLEKSLSALAESGAPQRIRLRAAPLEKDVLVTYTASEDPMHFDQPWIIRWTPAGGGPYPDFAGTLTVRADEDYTTCVLELRGEYVPPGGVAGAAFDAVVGSRVASATAREFLRALGAQIEAEFKREESAKGASLHAQDESR